MYISGKAKRFTFPLFFFWISIFDCKNTGLCSGSKSNEKNVKENGFLSQSNFLIESQIHYIMYNDNNSGIAVIVLCYIVYAIFADADKCTAVYMKERKIAYRTASSMPKTVVLAYLYV